MPETIVIATQNLGKVQEFSSLLEPLGLLIQSLDDALDQALDKAPDEAQDVAQNKPQNKPLDKPQDKPLASLKLTRKLPPPKEDFLTFQENAQVKAHYYADALDLPCLADDSGLCVKGLRGAPGVHSARYGGSQLTSEERNTYLLSNMEGMPDREAYFQTVLVLAKPHDKSSLIWEGTVYGEISLIPKGENGFGYDPIFYVPELSATFGEISIDAKNKLSHRAKASALMINDIKRIKEFLNIA
jgi:XTP/dITP diphosphohydrolase